MTAKIVNVSLIKAVRLKNNEGLKPLICEEKASNSIAEVTIIDLNQHENITLRTLSIVAASEAVGAQ